MVKSVQKYGAITLTNLQNQLAYIWDALNRAFFIVIILLVFVQLWTAAYGARGETEIGGLTLADTIWYFLVAEMVELGKFRHDQKISEEVKDGSIAYTLGRPYNYLAYHFFNGLGDTVVKMGLIFLLGAPIALYYAGRPSVQWQHLPAVLLVAFLALLLDFFFLSMIGLLAFVVEDTFSFRLIYQKLVFILGGLLIPVDFLPGWLQNVARLLPFSLTVYAPARLFASFSWSQFSQVVALQGFWLAVIGVALYGQYRWATRRLVVNGG
ncbi:MAG: ABC-2 family transporter protein [Chloroflexi bacterium]|nr:ABC-2 family transporter protein [Chloroflexota bacterium]MCI0580011.1 ABC-2 family transporter protein [Chloroflexota bacterium]MCI0648464.1 ABC-2 family transporter protein [Chloroflexota bacterium]MCI0726645.1 ABC-2 family transporter protein [Chloroflexota bacterium]